MTHSRAGVAAVALVALLLAGCGKPATPKVDPVTEKAEATERARQRDYGGKEVRALEDAKKIENDINKKAEARDPDAK